MTNAEPTADPDAPDANETRSFLIRRPDSSFAAVCTFVFLVTAAALLAPHVSGTVLAMMVAFGGIGVLASWLCVRWRTLRVTVAPDRLTVGRRTCPWGRLKRITLWPWPAAPIRLVLSIWRVIGLPQMPIVLREILPAIFAHRPDLRVSDRLRQAMDDPECYLHPSRLTQISAGLRPLGLAIPLWLIHDPLVSIIDPIVILFVLMLAMVWSLPARTTPETAFITDMSAAPMVFLGPFAFLSWWLPLHVTDAVFTLLIVFSAASALMAWGVVRLTRLTRAVVLVSALALSGAVYAHGRASQWDRVDVAGLFGEKMIPLSLIWSEDGSMAAEFSSDGDRTPRQFALDVDALRAIALPDVGEYSTVLWLDRHRVVRRAREEENSTVHVYTFADDQDRQLATSNRIDMAIGWCVSPNGRRLCWTEWPEPGLEGTLKVFDFDTERTKTLPIAFPDSGKLRSAAPRWIDDRMVGVVAHGESDANGRRPPSPLHLVKINPDTGESERATVPQPMRRWSISPDYRYAVGLGEDDSQQAQLADLSRGTLVSLGASHLICWDRYGRWAWFLRDRDGRQWLYRLDPATMAETPLLEIPADMSLSGLSPRRRFALLSNSPLKGFWPLLVNIETGQRKRLDGAATFPFLISARITSHAFPWLGYWSGDGRRLMITHMSPLKEPHIQTHIYTLPDNWLADAPPTTTATAPRPR